MAAGQEHVNKAGDSNKVREAMLKVMCSGHVRLPAGRGRHGDAITASPNVTADGGGGGVCVFANKVFR